MNLGLYKLIKRIGAGGFGEVWEAVDASGRKFAIKKLRDRGRWFVEALRDEARKLVRLRGTPGVVQLVHHELDGPEPYLVLELADGSLADQIQGPMSVERALPIARQLAAVVMATHARGVVHRDIKPANILLKEGVVELADFGLAKGNESLLLTVGGAGTPGYMAPEQQNGQPTVKSDVFGLGATFFHLLTGQRPPVDGFALDPRMLVPGCPKGLAELVMQMTAFAPAQRPHLAAVRIRLRVIANLLQNSQPQPSKPPKRASSGGFWTALASVAGAVGLGLLVANSNSYDDNVQRYRSREGKFRSGRFG